MTAWTRLATGVALCLSACVVSAQEPAAVEPAAAAAAEAPVPAPTVNPAPAVSGKPVAPVVRVPEKPWELRPYKVQCLVTFESSPQLSESVRNEFWQGLKQRLLDDVGAAWELTMEPLAPANQIPWPVLEALTLDAAHKRWIELPQDKVLALSVRKGPAGWEFLAREWDKSSESLGPLQRGNSLDDRLAVSAASVSLREVFRPLVQVDAAAGREITLRIRAGELIPPDESWAPLVPGNFVTPFVRAFSRKGELQKVHALPWTYLKVDSVDRAKVLSTSFSIYPSPAVPTRKRMESLAIVTRPVFQQTRLQVVPRTSRGNPLAAARVDIVDKLAGPNDPDVQRKTMRTDRHGIVTVAADPTPQIRYAIVTSGQATLARVPFLPGVQEQMTIEVTDDSPRLSAEGEVNLLEADLVELVARRQVLLLRGDAASKAGKVEDVKLLTRELRQLPDQKAFQQRIDLARTAAVEAAKARKDQVAEARIRKMCAALGEASKTHLDDDKFQQTLKDLEDVADLRAPDRQAPGRKN